MNIGTTFATKDAAGDWGPYLCQQGDGQFVPVDAAGNDIKVKTKKLPPVVIADGRTYIRLDGGSYTIA